MGTTDFVSPTLLDPSLSTLLYSREFRLIRTQRWNVARVPQNVCSSLFLPYNRLPSSAQLQPAHRGAFCGRSVEGKKFGEYGVR